MSQAIMDFSNLEPVRIPLKVGTKSYVIMEASAGAAVAYENAMSGAIRFAHNSPERIQGMAEADPILVSNCVGKADGSGGLRLDTDGNPVTLGIKEVKAWPNSVFRAVYDKIKEISPDLEKKIVTIEGLTSQIDKLTEQRDKMIADRDAKKTEGDSPNDKGATTGISV